MFEFIFNNLIGLVEFASISLLPLAILFFLWIKWAEIWRKKIDVPIGDIVHNLSMQQWDSKKDALWLRFIRRFLMIVLPPINLIIVWVGLAVLFYAVYYMLHGDPFWTLF